jgi:hypothetical protein
LLGLLILGWYKIAEHIRKEFPLHNKIPLARADKAANLFGFIIGYILFACFLALYLVKTLGYFDSAEFALRLITPFTFRFRWTDLVCYVLIIVSCIGTSKLRGCF